MYTQLFLIGVIVLAIGYFTYARSSSKGFREGATSNGPATCKTCKPDDCGKEECKDECICTCPGKGGTCNSAGKCQCPDGQSMNNSGICSPTLAKCSTLKDQCGTSWMANDGMCGGSPCVPATECQSCGSCPNGYFDADTGQCTTCSPGSYLDGQTCSPCNCSNGTPSTTATDCTATNERCSTCDTWYYSDDNKCKPTCNVFVNNQGTCGANQMPEDTTTHCGDTCTPEKCCKYDGKCKCTNGIADNTCTEGQQKEKCKSCDPGYYLDTDYTCQPCTCTHGPASTISTTCQPNVDSCIGPCDQGYYLDGDTCKPCGPNQCGGTCNDCASSATCINNKCVPNQCICPHGTAAGICDTDGEINCTQCNPNYHLVGKTCVPNQCTCPYGTAATICDTDGEIKCTKCNPTYHLVGNTCVPNKCDCLHGIPSTTCGNNGETKCTQCDEGYYLQANICVPDIPCNCPHGTGALDCTQVGTTKCIQCDEGYYLQGNICKPNQTCSTFHCPSGYATSTSSIPCKGKSCLSAECCTRLPPPPPPTQEESDINVYYPNMTIVDGW